MKNMSLLASLIVAVAISGNVKPSDKDEAEAALSLATAMAAARKPALCPHSHSNWAMAAVSAKRLRKPVLLQVNTRMPEFSKLGDFVHICVEAFSADGRRPTEPRILIVIPVDGDSAGMHLVKMWTHRPTESDLRKAMTEYFDRGKEQIIPGLKVTESVSPAFKVTESVYQGGVSVAPAYFRVPVANAMAPTYNKPHGQVTCLH